MNSEYHNLPVPYFLNSDYNEYRETGNLLHIEGVSSCTDAEKLRQEKTTWIISWAEKHTDEEISLLIYLYQSFLQDQ